MYSVFLSSYTNTRESLGELEKAVETLACGSYAGPFGAKAGTKSVTKMAPVLNQGRLKTGDEIN